MAGAGRPADGEGGREPGGPLLTPELAAFCESGLNVAAATCAGEGWPFAIHALGCRIAPGGTMRVLLHLDANRPAVTVIAAGAGVAATFSRPSDHRSIQFKARRAEVAEADAADRASLVRQRAAYREALAVCGYPVAFTDALIPHDLDDLIAIAFVPDEAFVQTPGPGAGDALR